MMQLRVGLILILNLKIIIEEGVGVEYFQNQTFVGSRKQTETQTGRPY